MGRGGRLARGAMMGKARAAGMASQTRGRRTTHDTAAAWRESGSGAAAAEIAEALAEREHKRR